VLRVNRLLKNYLMFLIRFCFDLVLNPVRPVNKTEFQQPVNPQHRNDGSSGKCCQAIARIRSPRLNHVTTAADGTFEVIVFTGQATN